MLRLLIHGPLLTELKACDASALQQISSLRFHRLLDNAPLVLNAATLLGSNAQLTRMKQSANTKRWVVKGGGVRLARRVLLLAAPEGI